MRLLQWIMDWLRRRRAVQSYRVGTDPEAADELDELDHHWRDYGDSGGG